MMQGGAHQEDHYTYPKGHHPVNTSEEQEGDVELTVTTSANINRRNGGYNDVDTSESSHDQFHDEHLDEDYVIEPTTGVGGAASKEEEHPTIGSARTPWYGTAIVLLSEVMGTGILSLPFAAKTLGWASAMLSVPLFAAFSAYSGWLLSQVQQQSGADGVKLTSFAEAATYLLGPTFGMATKVAMLLSFGATAIYYLIATADGIEDITGVDCAYQRSFVAACLLILPCQCRDFHAISKYLSGPSTCAIVLMVFIIMGNLLLSSGKDNTKFGDSTAWWPQEGTTPLQYLEALSAFVFAYQGHAIFLELMSEMKDAHKFPVACGIAYGIMCIMYGLVVIVAYGLSGANTEEFLPDILPPGTARQMVGVLVCLHITVSYVIAGQPLHMWLHSTLFPQSYLQEGALGSIHWFVVTGGYLVFGYVVGNLIPFFADVQALIGSLFGAPTVFGWPVAFYLATRMKRQRQQQAADDSSSWWWSLQQGVGWGNLVICGLFLLVFTPLFCILGTTGAITSIVRDAEHSQEPFQCTTED